MSIIFSKILFKICKKISYYWNSIFINKKGYYNILLENRNRLPKELEISNAINNNNSFLAGRRIILETKDTIITIKVIYKNKITFNHMSEIATSGIDIYEYNNNYVWLGTVSPNNCLSMKATKTVMIDKGFNNVILYLPPFAEIKSLLIKSDQGVKIIEEEKPKIIVYGSSISQGCAASRASLSYVNVLSRLVDYQIMNFGYSEGCRGEKEIINYISNLHADIYLIEYDHNSEIEELRKNHINVYKNIRNENKKSKIVFLSRISGGISVSKEENDRRLKIITDTYKFAKDNNDNNVFFINGDEIFDNNKDLLLVDDRHPNDMGMNLIANKIFSIISEQGGRK